MANTPAKKTPRKRVPKPVEAKIVAAEPDIPPIPAVVVDDKRDRLGKRLAIVAFGILILYFVVSSLIQSAQNGAKLDKANTDRGKLIDTVNQLTTTLNANTRLISQLQAAVRAQNNALKAAGITPVAVPGVTAPETSRPNNSLSTGGGSPNAPTISAAPAPNPQPNPAPGPANPPSGHPSPSPRPSPTPTPVVPAGELVCNLVGICLN